MVKTKRPTPEEIAFVAGIYEGEGSIVCSRFQPMIRICMSDRDTLERLQTYMGLGRINGPYNRTDAPTRKPMWVFVVSRIAEIESFVGLTWPWLSDRRRTRICESFAKRRQHVSDRGVVAPLVPLSRHGAHNPRAKLTLDQVSSIREQWGQRLSQKDIAEQFGVSQALVWLVIHGHTPEATHGQAKLTLDQAESIRLLWSTKGGVTESSLGKEYGVSRSTVGSVIGGKTWTRD